MEQNYQSKIIETENIIKEEKKKNQELSKEIDKYKEKQNDYEKEKL